LGSPTLPFPLRLPPLPLMLALPLLPCLSRIYIFGNANFDKLLCICCCGTSPSPLDCVKPETLLSMLELRPRVRMPWVEPEAIMG
jgi:hypothetical protein